MSSSMGPGSRHDAVDEPLRSATFKIVAGLLGVLAVGLVWVAPSFADDNISLPGDSPAPAFDAWSCLATADDGHWEAVIGLGMYENEEYGCERFFYLDEVTGQKVLFKPNRGLSCGEGATECEDGLEIVVHAKLSDQTCTRIDRNLNHRLVGNCLAVTTVNSTSEEISGVNEGVGIWTPFSFRRDVFGSGRSYRRQL